MKYLLTTPLIFTHIENELYPQERTKTEYPKGAIITKYKDHNFRKGYFWGLINYERKSVTGMTEKKEALLMVNEKQVMRWK